MTHPKIINIGNRAFIFGGAYSNLQATQAVFEHADRLGFTHEQIIFTGDSVAYCGQPQETATLIRSSQIPAIMGNCEEALAAGSPDCGCGFEDDSACSLLSVEWFAHCQKHIDLETTKWMGSLPRELIIQIGGFNLLCTHATPDEINRFVFPSSLSDLNPDHSEIDGYIVGHSGIPFLSNINGKAWINSGAAGMPANDGTSRVWYATLEIHNGQLQAQTHALDYDYQATASAMRASGMNNGYTECLATGIWPSHDVLPDTEKLLTGARIEPQICYYDREISTPHPHIPESLAS